MKPDGLAVGRKVSSDLVVKDGSGEIAAIQKL